MLQNIEQKKKTMISQMMDFSIMFLVKLILQNQNRKNKSCSTLDSQTWIAQKLYFDKKMDFEKSDAESK